ncbi:MAG TPA: hypothetical protein VKA06_05575, partial [Spirochaetia bacterium]|nr:hypothetical protein [Spirochaetia bacterium]
YEDLWEGFPGQRSAETRRRVCWEIAMAGCYQTNGETTRTGTGEGEDSGGGWISGRGDESMTMFDTIIPMVEFFESFDWWRLKPDPGALLSYDPGRTDGLGYFYPDGRAAADRPAQILSSAAERLTVVYLPCGGRARVSLAGSGPYRIEQWDPRTGAHQPLDGTSAKSWTSPWTGGPQDVVYLITG